MWKFHWRHIGWHRSGSSRRYINLSLDFGFPPAQGPVLDAMIQIELREGRHDKAAELAASGLPPEMAAGSGPETMRLVYRALQDRAKAGRAIDALDRLLGYVRPGAQLQKRRFMLWYVQLGALDRAFELLTQSLDHFARSGTIGAAWGFLWMHEMLPFRRDPRFQLICRRMGLFEYWNVYGPPDNCQLRAGQLICD